MTTPKDLLKEEVPEDNPYAMNGPNVRAGMILTDKDLVGTDIVHWSGYGFTCKICGYPAVMHFMKYCGNCGAAVTVQSNKVDVYLDKTQGKYSGR